MDVLKNLNENPTIATHIRIWLNSATILQIDTQSGRR